MDREAIRIIEQRIARTLSRLHLGSRRGRISLVETFLDGTRLKAALTVFSAGDDVEQSRPARVMQHYGFGSYPLVDAEAVVIPVGSSGAQGIIIATEHAEYRLVLSEGEVALYDHLGQYVHLKSDGKIHVKANNDIVLNDGTVSVAGTGDSCDVEHSLTAPNGGGTVTGSITVTIGETSRTVKV